MKIFTTFSDAVLRDDPPGGPAGGTPPAPAPVATPPAPVVTPGAGDPPPAPAPGAPAATPPVATPPATPGTGYKPDGIPDHLLGANDQETIDKLLKSVNGFRKDAGDVPEKAEGYKNFGEIDAAIKPYMDTLTNDPVFDRVAEMAKAEGIPLGKFQNLTKAMLTAGVELGIYEPPIDVVAERAALTPETAKHLPAPEQKLAIERRMTDNMAFLDTLVAPQGQQGLSKDSVDFVKAMLGDRAVGHQFIEHMRAQLQTGKGPMLQGGGAPTGDPKADISRRQALAENTWGNPKFDQKSYDQLQKDARAVYGD